MATQPYRNVAYGLSEALLNVAQAPIIAQRNPATTDRAQLGTEWINQINDDVWILVKVEDNISTWVLITSGSGGGVNSLDGDTGNAVPTAGVITIAGAGDVTTAASGSTVTVTGSGVDIFDTDSGTATGSSNTIAISGGNGITTSGSGSTVTITASASVPLTFDGDTGTAIPATNAITMHGTGDITTSAAGSTVTFVGSGITTLHSGSGSATASSNAATIAGGTGITTSATGSTVTITATGSFASPVTVPNGGTGDTSFTPYAVITGGTTSTGALQNVVGLGASGEVLTSAGAGALPSWAPVPGSTGAETFDSDSGTATTSGNTITMHGAGDITTSATGSTVTFTGAGVTTLHSGSGNATVSSNAMTIAGGTGITTTATGSTVTITAAASVPLTFDGDTGTATPSANVITLHGTGDIATSATGSTVTFAGSGVTTVHSGSGSATASSNAITIAGGTGITTTATGSTVTITASGGSGIVTLDGNTSSATGSTVTITTGSSNANGTARFLGNGVSQLSLNFSDSNSNLGLGATGLGSGTTLSGSFNTCLGVSSGEYISSGGNNTFIGYSAGKGNSGTPMTTVDNTGIGINSLINLQTGLGGNTCIGSGSGDGLVSGAYNTLLGGAAGSNYTSSESSNICIGADAVGTAAESHVLRIGSGTGASSVGNLNAAFISGIQGITVTGTAVLVSSSDQLGVAASSKRFKNDIQDMESASEVIYKLRPVTFTWNRNSAPGLKDAPQARQCGLIAEEVAPLLPQIVGFDKNGTPLNINYGDLTSLLVNEIQKLNTRILALEALCQKG